MFESWINGYYRSREDLLADRWLLEQSDIFDAAAYRAAAGISQEIDAAERYLHEGWRRGLEPGPWLEGSFLFPYFRSVGFNGPPAITYLTLRANGAAVYLTRAATQAVAAAIHASGLFDVADYAKRAGDLEGLDPLLHYVVVGENIGLAPSAKFDPVYYGARYPDVARVPINRLYHYVTYGRSEGRRPVSAVSELPFDFSRLVSERPTVLLGIHQASRTGAPILGYNIARRLRERYNVIALLLSGGELVKDFQACCTATIGPFTYADWHPVEMDYAIKRIVGACPIFYAIANSIECRFILKPLTLAQVPEVTLVHEFSSYTPPKGEIGRALEWTTQTVFSANIVAASARADYPSLANRTIHILPQGRVELPPREANAKEEQSLRAAMRPPGAENALVVLGCGTIISRKGVDIFLECAAAVAALAPRRPVRFVWIGATSGVDVDQKYFASLSEQLRRAAQCGNFVRLDEVSRLETAYALADVFFLSSRLDPLPNVCIEAALCGLPIVCFENSTGFAEILRADSATRMSVISDIDVDAAARVIVGLADDDVARKELGAATRRIAERTFDMDRYVRDIDRLGREAVGMIQQRVEDLKTIASDPIFDSSFFLDLNANETRDEAIRLYLAQSAVQGTGAPPTLNFRFRRPCPGFHPQIYAHENAAQFDPAIVNPLAHFIRSGKPEGPWRTEVIIPSADANVSHRDQQRIALHGHFHYPELATDFCRKLAMNHSRCDLLLSTSSRYKAWILRAATAGYDRGEVMIRVVPNRGRDIGAFLTAFAEDIGRYDIIGHVHGKRSLFTGDQTLGNSWREFIWQNLLGDMYPMMDTILGRMAEDGTLGLVFPSDPHMSDWDANREIATNLAERMGIKEPLPPFFDFPIGTMFWARTLALQPLLALKLGWKDYPTETIAIDATVLHAIERLLPFVVRQAGYQYTTTYVPGMTW